MTESVKTAVKRIIYDAIWSVRDETRVATAERTYREILAVLKKTGAAQ